MTFTVATAPGLLVGITVCAYWLYVARLTLRTAAAAGGLRGMVVAAQRRERWMMAAWAPLIGLWTVLPLVAAGRPPGGHALWAIPEAAASSGAVVLRFAAAALAIGCLLLSRTCWRRMGRDWRMAVDPHSAGKLFCQGPFGVVRHPIYALSMLLALCTLAAVPTPPLAAVVAIHLLMMNLKARNEERFLHAHFGPAYADYCRSVGRFLPRRLSALRQWREGSSAEAAAAPGGPALSPFQRMMLLFEGLHPYNAVHAVRVSRPVDPAALESAIRKATLAAGIGALVVEPHEPALRYAGACPVSLRALPATDEPERVLAQVIDEEMNRPFPAGAAEPLRWVVFAELGEKAHWLVLAYRHIVADGAAATALLASVLGIYLEGASAAQMTTELPRRATDFVSPRSRRGHWLQLVRTIQLYFRLRFAHRMPDEKGGGDRTHVLIAQTPETLLARLAAATRALGAGLNDAFLAGLAAAIASQTPDRHVSRHRRKLVLASALSGRRGGPEDLAAYFGVVLGDVLIDLQQPDAPPGALLRAIADQTRARKRDWRGAVALAEARCDAVTGIWPLLSIPHNRRSYRKLFPICGGVSTVVMERAHLGSAAPLVTRYVRACPPGPATPIVLAPTVFDGRLELTLVIRDACRAPGDRRLLDELINALSEIGHDGSGQPQMRQSDTLQHA